MTHDVQGVDVVGVGAGPFNMSLAALMSRVPEISAKFFDRKSHFSWHEGMLLPEAEMQVSHFKDLVTLVDPTNPYSFIAYLAKHKRLYQFLNSKFKNVLRREFDHYLRWVSQSLPNIQFNESVNDVEFEHGYFNLQTSNREVRARHLVLGGGLSPNIPLCAEAYLGDTVFHNSEFMLRNEKWRNQNIVVIGGGQSGAEIINHLLSCQDRLPTRLTWVTRRSHLLPMDDSAFVNEFFTPNYTDYFYRLDEQAKVKHLKEQELASDGVSAELLQQIYQKIYRWQHLDGCRDLFHLLPQHELKSMVKQGDYYQLLVEELGSGRVRQLAPSIVILCTGYHWKYPSYLSRLKHRIPLQNDFFIVNLDYSIAWEGPHQNRIYVQNAARHTHGIADPNFSLMAWRSAKIINSICETSIYNLEDEQVAHDWQALMSTSSEKLRCANG